MSSVRRKERWRKWWEQREDREGSPVDRGRYVWRIKNESLCWKGESLEFVPGAVSTGSVDRAMASGR